LRCPFRKMFNRRSRLPLAGNPWPRLLSQDHKPPPLFFNKPKLVAVL
jgi:hypothetical protein